MNNRFYELYSVKTDGSDLKMIDKSERYCGSQDWSDYDSKIVYSKSRNDLADELDLFLYDIQNHTIDTLTSEGTKASAKFTSDNRIVYCHQMNDTQMNNTPSAIFFNEPGWLK